MSMIDADTSRVRLLIASRMSFSDAVEAYEMVSVVPLTVTPRSPAVKAFAAVASAIVVSAMTIVCAARELIVKL